MRRQIGKSELTTNCAGSVDEGLDATRIPNMAGPAMALVCFFLSMFIAAGFVMLSLKYGLREYPGDQALLAGIGAGAWSGLVAIVMPLIG